LTPERIKRTENAEREAARPANHVWIYLVIVAATISVSLFFLRRFTAGPEQSALNGVSTKSIAVLPFENRSEDKANAYFAEGIQDEILTRLSKIADLKVISRTSTQHYKASLKICPKLPNNLESPTSWKEACKRAATPCA
jgi:hypothetical protein